MLNRLSLHIHDHDHILFAMHTNQLAVKGPKKKVHSSPCSCMFPPPTRS